MPTVAEQLASTLAAAGVERIYGVVGDSLNGLTDAIRRQGVIQWVHVRHEEVAAFAAGAEAHLTGSLAVCAGSCGPGNLHLINGLFDCHRSRVPVLAIAAHIPSAEVGSGYFQETHPENLFKECSHYCELISVPEQMPRSAEIAIREAVGKSGVSVLVMSGDVALQPASSGRISSHLIPPAPIVTPPADGLRRLAELLNGAVKVTVLGGSGCAGAHAQLIALGAKLKCPIVHALRGKEHLEWDNPYSVGMTGFIGTSSGFYAMNDCDLLLMLGTDFPYREFYPRSGASIVQIDRRPEQLGRRAPLMLGLVGDVAATLDAVLPSLEEKSDRAFLDRAVAHHQRTRRELEDLAKGTPGKGLIHPQQVAKALSDQADDDAIFTCDVGLPTVWAARYAAMNGKRRLLGSFWHGSMANALAQAIGAKASHPERQVIALAGDGGFSMLMGDILSLVQLNLPIKVVVMNNSTLGFVELEQKASGFLDFGTTFQNPDFAALARAVGLHGIRVDDPGDVESAISEALAHRGPVLVDAVVNRQELAIPPQITASMAKGFTLYMVKAVMDGRANEVIDLAASNLWR